MRIAVSYENGQVFQHFGHTPEFKLYDIADGIITKSLVIRALGSGHEALTGFLSELRVNALICGGIGGSARAALEEAGILLYGGVSGEADAAAAAFVAGTLGYDPEIHCKQHGEGEPGCGGHACPHSCGDAGCHAHHHRGS